MARTMLACTTAVALTPQGVARADSACARVQATDGLAGPWLDAVHELERQIEQLPASDCTGGTLRIEPADGAARVVVLASDGRRAARLVRSPAGLVATGLGLVMAIPAAESPPAPSAPAVPSGNVPPAASSPISPRASSVEAPRLALWLGFDVGGRTAVPASVATADASVHGDIRLDHWLFTITVRDSVVGFAPAQGLDNDAFREVNVALGVGRRLEVGDTAFDLILAPAIAAMRLEWDYPGDKEASGEDVELSINALARVALPVAKGWALTLTVESELVPGNLTTSPGHLEAPSGVPAGSMLPPNFPAWTGGLRVGAMGSLL